MSEVFVSCKREDEVRVSAVVRALEQHGLAVWWDRGVVAGENWRARIDSELDEARAVVVCWTDLTVGSAGRFVQDEAERARRAGKLVSVLLDKVTPPAGFATLPAIELRHFARGLASALSGGRLGASAHDPFVLDLVAAVRATMAGEPAPRPRGRRLRLVRRLAWGGLAGALGAAALAFATNTLGLQERACTLDIAQPALSDRCGAWGLGDRPTQAERLAWAARPRGTPQSCEALRGFMRQFPHGRHAAEAAALLAARKENVEQRWTSGERPLPLRESATAGPDRGTAEQAALDRAQAHAERQCQNLETSGLIRVRHFELDAKQWDCHPEGGKAWACVLDAVTTCQLDEGREIKTERCD
ncbi:MAG: hypothetical protein RIQ60_1751 [Pseudomonadota bacterium]